MLLLPRQRNVLCWKLLNNSAGKKGYVLIGKIVGVHGIKGANKFKSYADSLSVYQPDRSLLMRDSKNRESSVEINWVKSHTGTPLISFKGVTDHDQAQALDMDEVRAKIEAEGAKQAEEAAAGTN